MGLYVQNDHEHRLFTNCMFSDPILIESLLTYILYCLHYSYISHNRIMTTEYYVQ